MYRFDIDNSFLDALHKKIPEKPTLANTIADILMIEKESVYRRLRGDVRFTLAEAGILAGKLGISLDGVMGGHTGKKQLLLMEMPVNSNASAPDYELMENFATILKQFSEQPYSEQGMALNSFPPSVYWAYPLLSHFYMLKWGYMYHNDKSVHKFSDIVIPERLLKIQAETDHWRKRIGYTYYILTPSIIKNILEDIHYFRDIKLISDNDLRAFKDELMVFLSELEKIAAVGKFPDTGKRFELYLSNINFATTYTYFWSEDICTCMLTTFVIQAAGSFNEETCLRIKNWVSSLKKASILISEVGERERITFFREQKRLVETLL